MSTSVNVEDTYAQARARARAWARALLFNPFERQATKGAGTILQHVNKELTAIANGLEKRLEHKRKFVELRKREQEQDMINVKESSWSCSCLMCERYREQYDGRRRFKFSDENDIASNIKAQRGKLSEIMEPNFGLIPKLISSGVLNWCEKSKIEAETTTSGRNKMLLDLILAKGKLLEFMNGLLDSDQIHVINWIEGNGVYKPEYDSEWPLEEREIKIIDRNFYKLSNDLEIAHGLLDILLSNGIINYQQMEFLKKKTKRRFRHSEDFLSILRRFSRGSFSATLECLRELNQGHVAKLLKEQKEGGDYNSDNASDLPLDDGKIKLIERKYDWLVNNLDIEYGLLVKLFSKNIINYQTFESLRTDKKNFFEHNEDFLGILRRFSCRSFSLTLECLRELNQGHVAKLLEEQEEGGDYNSDNASDLPLDDEKIKLIERKYDWLIDNLDIEYGLLDQLLSKNIINDEMYDSLRADETSIYERIEDFLGILRRSNKNSFSLTVECLRKSNQDHVAELLEKGDPEEF